MGTGSQVPDADPLEELPLKCHGVLILDGTAAHAKKGALPHPCLIFQTQNSTGGIICPIGHLYMQASVGVQLPDVANNANHVILGCQNGAEECPN